MSDFRVMGRWRDMRTFLVTLGDSADDCEARLSARLEELTDDEIGAVESLWLERWDAERRAWELLAKVALPKLTESAA